MNSFKMRTAVIQEKTLYLRIFWGLLVSMLGLYIVFLLKVGLCLGAV